MEPPIQRPATSESPVVVYSWRGPGGPFLLPLEVIVSQPVKVVVTAFLAPTTLAPAESQWLAHMATAAQSLGEQNQVALGQGAMARRADATASLAGPR